MNIFHPFFIILLLRKIEPFFFVSYSDEEDWGCDGGDPVTAYEYIARTGGLETETDYPYASSDGVLGTCAVSDSSQFLVSRY